MAAFAAPIIASPGVAVLAASDATLTMTPVRRLRMPGSTALAICIDGSASWVSIRPMSAPAMSMNSSCGVRIRCVADDKVRSSTEFGDRLRGQLAAFGVATGDHDPGYAGRCERPGRCQPDAGRAAHD